MSNHWIKAEVDKLIDSLQLGETFTVAEIYEQCHTYGVTLGQISYLVRVHPSVEHVGRQNSNCPRVWRRV